jgi:hypothetical protein
MRDADVRAQRAVVAGKGWEMQRVLELAKEKGKEKKNWGGKFQVGALRDVPSKYLAFWQGGHVSQVNVSLLQILYQ